MITSASMASEKQNLLKRFGQIVTDIQLLLRARPLLTDNEQLFLENRLMILQLEYNLWANRPIKVLLEPDIDLPPLHIKRADLTPALSSLELLESRQAYVGEESIAASTGESSGGG